MMQGIMSKLDQLRQGTNMGGGSPMPQQTPQSPLPPQEAMMPAGLMQDAAPEMVAEVPSVDPNQEVQMLADAVIKRSGGDPQTALDILEGAKGVVIQAIQGSQRPQMMEKGGPLKPIPEDNKGLAKLPEEVRNNMGYMAEGGSLNELMKQRYG